MTLKSYAYAPVRTGAIDPEYIETNAIHFNREHCEMMARREDTNNPTWAKKHGLIRIAEVEIVEVKG